MKEFLIQRYRPDPSGPAIHPTLLRVDVDGRITLADRYAEAMFGYHASELTHLTVQHILASRQDDPFAPAHRHRLANGQTVLVTFKHKEGFFFTASLGLRLETLKSPSETLASITLKDSQQMDGRLFGLAERSASFGYWELDVASNDVFWSDAMFRLLELRVGTDLSPEQALFYCQSHQNRVRALIRRCMRSGQPFSIELPIITSSQRLMRATLTGQALKSGGQIHRLGGVLVNHSSAMRHDEQKQQAQRLLEATASATPDLVLAIDTSFNLLYFNEVWEQHFRTAFNLEPQPGDNLKSLLNDFPNERRLMESLWQKAFERDRFVAEMPLFGDGASSSLFELHFQRIHNDNGEVAGAVRIGKDISDRVMHNSGGDHRMRHDPITGLMNRRAFSVHLERAISHRHKRQLVDSLLFLDIDDFDGFNKIADTGTCDRYLRELASTLNLRVRKRDALARLGGDTFALFIENCPESRARTIADEVREQIARFQFEWQGTLLQTTVSGGLLIIDKDAPEQPDILLSQAADLCHTAKTSGRDRIHTAHALPTEKESDTGSERRLQQLRQALEDETLVLEFQALKPVASVTWGDHVEILCRIPAGPDNDLLKPEHFLPVAERYDLAKMLDRQVIRQTLAWLSQHRLLVPRLKYCGFNLSLASVLDDTFTDFLEQAVALTPFAASCFCLEIRESHATRYPDEVAVLCDSLHQIGCRVALEGAGASVESYSLAANLPVDIIKLDKRVMHQLENDPVQQIMVDALHRIAETTGKETVATFIENDATLRKVRSLGIHFGQGYRLARPQPLEDLTPAVVDLSTGRIGG
ncbi:MULTISPECIES: EAL domain-containing protein [unclassified Marinobacter]|uniref:EAL domain-containing protein n=1 Tax=unclassified Marinobacter TaxID=83889 RepID=UPI00273CCCA7|nr:MULTISPECIES: EAL domain-containing protein [unclassified Marinobacter]MDP4548161.1 EAL domain-containing protein [Marinobacter sp. MDS2]